jgi:transposase-like protein
MVEVRCKYCGGDNFRLNGKMKGKQRYYCRVCERTFTVSQGDKHTVEKKLVIVLYGTGKASFRYLGKLVGKCPATIMNWVRDYGEMLAEPVVSPACQDIEIDEMWHFLGSKKTSCGFSKPLLEKAEKLLHGLQASGIPLQSKNSMPS